ncbi:unannotated protein [freshwater metagenome]|uniref:Unannotated protein n=1 Tax=freshwater metagenome TaxID=449393 RepID=A0A6J5YC39_9ZZZZ
MVARGDRNRRRKEHDDVGSREVLHIDTAAGRVDRDRGDAAETTGDRGLISSCDRHADHRLGSDSRAGAGVEQTIRAEAQVGASDPRCDGRDTAAVDVHHADAAGLAPRELGAVG